MTQKQKKTLLHIYFLVISCNIFVFENFLYLHESVHENKRLKYSNNKTVFVKKKEASVINIILLL